MTHFKPKKRKLKKNGGGGGGGERDLAIYLKYELKNKISRPKMSKIKFA